MVIGIVPAITQILHQPCRGIQNMRWRHQRPGGRGRACCPLQCRIGSIGLWCGGQIDHQAGDGQIALRAAQPFIGLPCSKSPRQGFRFGKADILGCKAGQATQDIMRVLAAGKHPRQPVQGGIGVRSAQRLVQRGHQIVMLVAGAIKGRCPAGNNFGKGSCVNHLACRHPQQRCRHIQQIAPVPVRHCQQRLARRIVKGQCCACVGLYPRQQGCQRIR